jgi:hypothetical protein
VLRSVGAFLAGGDVFAVVLFLQDEEVDAFALGGDGEVRRCLPTVTGRGGAAAGVGPSAAVWPFDSVAVITAWMMRWARL